MKTTTQKLTEWAINKIKSEYPDDVALLVAVEEHCVNGDGHGECFDYYVPATKRGNELGRTFIIGGVGHDLYPRTWERTERTANLDDRATRCLGRAKILYSRSKEDEVRFEVLRQKLFDNLGDRAFAYKKALERIDAAMSLYRTMMFEDALYKVRMAAGYISEYLTEAVFYLNGAYPDDRTAGNVTLLSRLEERPDGLIQYIKAMICAKTAGELKSLTHLMIAEAREYAALRSPEKPEVQAKPDFHGLADWYQELSLTFRRLYYYCDTGNAGMAIADACVLQNELMIEKEEFGLGEMDLLGFYGADDLAPLKERAAELEKYIVSVIEGHGVKIDSYDTVEAFLKNN